MSRPEPQPEKVAVAVAAGPDGTPRVVASGRGRQAEELVERAREGGLEVHKDARRVEELLREESEGANVPLEIYELMATVINFAQELNEARWAPGAPAAGDALEASPELSEGGSPT